MDKILIHKAKCMECYRTGEGILTTVFRQDDEPLYQQVLKAIHNAADKMRILEDSGFTPKLLGEWSESILQEDWPETEGLKDYTKEDWDSLRRALIRCLITLRQKHIRHGDLNGRSGNIRLKNKKPYFIDWWDSHFTWEEPPQTLGVRFTDSYWIIRSLSEWSPDSNVSDFNRWTRRWGAILNELVNIHDCSLPMEGKTLLDVGCYQGDFSALAAAENMIVTGIDTSTFCSPPKSIEVAQSIWNDIPNLIFVEADVMDWPNFNYDVILFMDTFPYITGSFGWEAGIKLLKRMVNEAGCVFFETQMWGDKTGIEFLKTDEDVMGLVPGALFKKLVTFPQLGFPRTLWKIQKEVN